ncbi:MAG: hypothetical protein OXD34_06870 [bacterium]|nr:hypothetical protein [bacterium]
MESQREVCHAARHQAAGMRGAVWFGRWTREVLCEIMVNLDGRPAA